jgi:hypothetical protein
MDTTITVTMGTITTTIMTTGMPIPGTRMLASR